MIKRQAGFTLIELVVVIVILGILAAVAIPKFIDLRSEASAAALAGVAGAADSAMAVNYAGCSALNNVATANKCVTVDACGDVTSLVQGGSLAGYTVAANSFANGTTSNGTSGTCTISKTGVTGTASFTAIAAGNN